MAGILYTGIDEIEILLAMPFALGITLWPMLRRGSDGKRHFDGINAILALIIGLLLFYILYGFAEALYRCDILQLPDCGYE